MKPQEKARGSLIKALLNDESLEKIDNFDVMALFLIFERRKGKTIVLKLDLPGFLNVC